MAPLPNRWKALSVTLVACFMTLLDVSIVAVAMPSIQRDLGAAAPDVQWVVSGYPLMYGLALVPTGRLGDALGHRRVFLVALAGFVVSSAASGASPTVTTLAIARVVQGATAGGLASQNAALVQQLFAGAERGRAFGMLGATAGLSTAMGPVAGGIILALAGGASGWRWIFYVNVPVGVAALVLAARLLPRGGVRRGGHLDVTGAGLLGAGVLALLLPLVEADAGGLRRLWWLFPVAAVLFAAFVRWEARVLRAGRAPLLDPRLVTGTPGYAGGASLVTVYFVGFNGIFLVFALYLQTGLGYSPLESGLAVSPFSVGSACAAFVAGRLVERLGRTVTVAGLSGVVVGLAAAAVVLGVAPPHLAGWWLAPALLFAGLGAGCVISPNMTMTLRNVPVSMAGAAGGALQTGQRVGGAVGTALLPGLYYVVLGARTGDVAAAAAVAIAAAAAMVAVALLIAEAERRRYARGDADRVDSAVRGDAGRAGDAGSAGSPVRAEAGPEVAGAPPTAQDDLAAT